MQAEGEFEAEGAPAMLRIVKVQANLAGTAGVVEWSDTRMQKEKIPSTFGAAALQVV